MTYIKNFGEITEVRAVAYKELSLVATEKNNNICTAWRVIHGINNSEPLTTGQKGAFLEFI